MPFKHGYARRGAEHPLYWVWRTMVSRCTYPSNNRYGYYGARGIRVCDRWRDFAAFLADMGERPSKKHSLDRIDNDGNYEPGNVRWATQAQQNANRRTPSRYVRRVPLRTSCRYGHPFTPENTKYHKGGRECRVCNRIADAEYRERKRQNVIRSRD